MRKKTKKKFPVSSSTLTKDHKGRDDQGIDQAGGFINKERKYIFHNE